MPNAADLCVWNSARFETVPGSGGCLSARLNSYDAPLVSEEQSIMKLYLTAHGIILESNGRQFQLRQHWNELINSDDLGKLLADAARNSTPLPSPLKDSELLAPLGTQEVWA